ncbi:MAG: UvrD-helicase domain-containing protein [Bacilli bacterium]|nr:UvrD-helicase domain-containing protein [Bacilli bacterium]
MYMKIDDLNKEQREAVLQTEGPLLILAGAGSGKTRVLTTKIAYLIEEIGISPYNILAITFTNKAAREMSDRLYKMIGDKAKLAQVSTFHSFGVRILRENYEYLGYDKNFVIMDSDDSLAVIKRILKENDMDPKEFNPNAIRNKISSCKNEMMGPNDYEKYAISDFDKVVLLVYRKYEDTLKKNNSIDFDDLLILPIKLFREHPSVLQSYQERFQYVLIDEYQDTNEAQYILSKMISAKYKNICCVGDVDQSIYSFRGANYRNILNFEKDYKDTAIIKLEQNYRSTTNILDAANDVIKNNKERKEKNLWSNKGTGEKITYYRAFNGIDEAQYVTREIKKLINNGIEYENIAILYRTNAQSHVMEEELLKNSIPYRIVGGIGFYSRKEIKDVLAYLRLIYNSKDNISLLRVINTPKRGIGNKTISNLIEKSNEQGVSIYDAISSGKELEFKNLIERFKEYSNSLTLTELVDKILDETGIKKEYEDDNTLESDIRLEYLEELKTVTRTFEERDGIVSLEDFLLEVSLVSDVNEYKDDKNRVSLMTVHSVKGLEFDYVFIIGLEEGIFPHMNSLMMENELEEERRLCYVAITRAKEKLYIVNARTRMMFGHDSANLPSRFINEINRDLLDGAVSEIEHKEEKINIEDKFYKEEANYSVGDFVYHEVFGQGKVLSISGSLIEIAFKHPHGIRKLMKNHKSLSKV